MPGAVGAELKIGTSDAASGKVLEDYYKRAILASIARAIAFGIEQPADVDVKQIVIRPSVQEFLREDARDAHGSELALALMLFGGDESGVGLATNGNIRTLQQLSGVCYLFDLSFQSCEARFDFF
jgi:hypothetical protein